MKKFNLLWAMMIVALFSVSLVGCSDDDDNRKPEPEPEPEDVVSGFYILNNGKEGNNNAGISFYNLEDGKVEADHFKTVNNRGLGDLAQDMIVYGEKIYVAVYGSGTIEIMDKKGNSIKQIKSEGVNPLLPRYLTSHEGKVYVSLFDGHVARIDTVSMEIDKTIGVGRNPEQLVVANNKLYVANSGGLDWNTPVGRDNTVSVIDLSTFTESKKIEVTLNPKYMLVDSQGDIYLISWGDFDDVPNTLQRISSDEKVEVVGYATEMAIADDKIYLMYSQYDADWNQVISYSVYDAIKEEMVADQFFSEDMQIKQPYKVLTAGSTVFMAESDYTSNGDIYMLASDGTLKKKFEVGVNPEKIIQIDY